MPVNVRYIVEDVDTALAFYRDVLGLEVRNDVAFEGMRWVTVGSPAQPDVEIVLEPPSPVESDAWNEHLPALDERFADWRFCSGLRQTD